MKLLQTSAIATCLMAIICSFGCVTAAAAPKLDKIELPPGFKIAVFAENVPRARSLTLGGDGTVFVGTREDTVYALADRDGDGRAEERFIIADNLNTPNGVAYKDGALYVAEISRVLRYDGIDKRLADPPEPAVVYDKLPSDQAHGWKFIAFGPDGKLYVPVGAPCNICERLDDPRYAAILRMNPDGSELEIFAAGIRNTVGFDWHPETHALWFTNNGRDWMGDDTPPDTLHHAPQKGMHFGYPYCHAGTISDPEFGKKRSCKEFAPPAQNLGPHVAALGMRFYTGSSFPEKYRGAIFIAEHGSWNRSKPIGYRLTLVRLEGKRSLGYEVFAEGWLQDGDAWGRPVDLEVLPDGSLLVSDDRAGVIYRITYAEGAAGAKAP